MFWVPTVTGKWDTDNCTGQKIAGDLLERIASSGNPTLLGHLMKSMVGHGDWTGVEVGFFHRLSEHIVTASAGTAECEVEDDQQDAEGPCLRVRF